MMSRCYSKDDLDYRRYKKNGITVCKRWFKFENFLADMGERPPNTTLDRIDNTKGYNKKNCRWACPITQANNRRNVIKYMGRTIREWSDFTGICYATLKSRYRKTGSLGL
jgi:hypothetical protein